MAYWLLKSDPETYGFPDLERDKTTVWDGVRNNLALRYLKQMKKGDHALIYHSGKDKQIEGIAQLTREAYTDPKRGDPKLVVVDLKVTRRLARPVTLSQIKADPDFARFSLVRMSRLSVMPVPEELWEKLLKMGDR
jgi:predicted RNA-binding protein with PUA-like domain